MKRILSFITLLYFTACTQVTHKERAAIADSLNQVPKTNSMELSEEILNQIKNYYYNEYGKGSRKEEVQTDSTFEITFYNLPKNKTDYDGFLMTITLAKRNSNLLYSAVPMLLGDLNNDEQNDLLVSAHTEGGGTGGNGIWWNDIFVFLKENGKYKMASVNKDMDLIDCNDGHFLMQKIENGYLVGNASCYAKEDALCCPSLNYIAQTKLLNHKLVFVGKREK